jgi:hypothetical protein
MMNATAFFLALATAAADCPPTAVIEGSDPHTQQLIAALTARGVRVEPPGLPPGDCGVLAVKLTENNGSLRVAISDPWGRTAERTVKSPLTAATLVETWARMELLESTQSDLPAAPQTPTTPSQDIPVIAETPTTPVVGTPRDQPAITAPVVTATAAATTATATTAAATPEKNAPVAQAETRAPAPEEDPSDPVMWRIGAELSLSDHEPEWRGLTAGLCGRLGFTCLGVSARYNFSERGDRADALIDLSAPIALGRLTLTPAIGAGVGGRNFAGGSRCVPRGDSCRLIRYPPEPFGLSPRAEARVDATLRLFGALGIQIGASATIDIAEDELSEDGEPLIRTYAGLAWGVP